MREINFNNFFENTFAIYKKVDSIKEIEIINTLPLDFDGGWGKSKYVYYKDYVYRKSNHWGDVASCQWEIKCEIEDIATPLGWSGLVENTYITSYIIGKCKISEFKNINKMLDFSEYNKMHNEVYFVRYKVVLLKNQGYFNNIANVSLKKLNSRMKKLSSWVENNGISYGPSFYFKQVAELAANKMNKTYKGLDFVVKQIKTK
jgi:hypothetical protein